METALIILGIWFCGFICCAIRDISMNEDRKIIKK